MLSSRQVPTMAAPPRGVGACAPDGAAESTANTPTMTEPSRDMGAPGDGLLRDASAVGPLGALALPAPAAVRRSPGAPAFRSAAAAACSLRLRRSEEHTSELQSRSDLVCRLLLEKKKTPNPNDRELTLKDTALLDDHSARH